MKAQLILLLSVFSTVPCLAGIFPAKTEINLAPVPIDKYLSPNSDAGAAIIPSCSQFITVRQCVQQIFQTGIGGVPGYISQNVTGVRFFIPLGGGAYNTPFHSVDPLRGTLQSTWLNNLAQFFSDLRTYGIQNITPTLVMDADWCGSSAGCDGCIVWQSRQVTACGIPKTFNFYPWLPFGLDTSDGPNFPDRTCGNNSYNSSPATPSDTWWGWQPVFNLIDAVLARAQQAGLTVADFDYFQEINLDGFTVEARVIYDNSHFTDVLGQIRTLMTNHGFSTGRVTTSVPIVVPAVASFDCGSFYGDSAMLFHESELVAALYSPTPDSNVFGMPPNVSLINDLPCFGSSDTTGMIALPISYSQPTVTDVHSSINTSDVTATATNLYSDVWNFLVYRGLTANYVNFGETNPSPTNPGACPPFTRELATNAVQGFLASSLYANDASNTALRVWHILTDTCDLSPNLLKPSYGN